MTHPLRVMIIDDHPLMCEAVKRRVVEITQEVDFAYVGGSVRDALAEHARARTDCVILDLDLGDGIGPAMNTLDLVAADCRVLVVSALADPATIRSVLRAGALGYVSKQVNPEEFEECFLLAVAGTPSTSRDVAAVLASDEFLTVPLSERERTAMVLYASGLKLTAVARHMNVRPATAQEYIRRVRSKYARIGADVSTKTALYRRARDEGLVP